MKRIIICIFLAFCFLRIINLITIPPLEAQEEITEITTEGYRYAVRLPEGYHVQKRYPVLFCFHNSGDGIEAIRTFGFASYELGWITIGFIDLSYSNLDQKAWKDIILAQEAVLKDVEKK